MNLAMKYVRFASQSGSLIGWDGYLGQIFTIAPSMYVSFLFSPDVEYTPEVIIFGFLCSLFVILSFVIGIYSLTQKNYISFLSFLVVPIILFVGMLEFIYTSR